MGPEPHLSHFIQRTTLSLYSKDHTFTLFNRPHFHFIQQTTLSLYSTDHTFTLFNRPHFHFIQWTTLSLYSTDHTFTLFNEPHFHFIRTMCFFLIYENKNLLNSTHVLFCKFSPSQIFAPITRINTSGSRGYLTNRTKYQNSCILNMMKEEICVP